MAIDQQQMMQAIYDTLFGAFTSPPPGASGEGASQADQTYLTLMWPGQQLDPADFANPWGPNNTTGSVFATENFSKMVDEIPSMNPIYSPKVTTISSLYGMVLKAQVVPPPPDPAAEQALKDANDFLQADVTDVDSSTGATKTVKGDSPVYLQYKAKKLAYDNAVTTMMNTYIGYDISNPSDQQKWSLLGPPLIDAVNTAWDDWGNANKDKVEDELAVQAQSSNNQIGQVFDDAKAQYTQLRRASTMDAGGYYWSSHASPGNWFAESAAASWTTATLDSESLYKSEHSDMTSSSEGGSGGWGLWSVGASHSSSDQHQSMAEDTSSLKVSFEYARIDINRPWLNFLLFSLKGWKMTDMEPGSYSSGNRVQPDSATFPLLPTSFIAVRNLKITASWGHEDSSFTASATSSGGSVGWGPFSISGSYSHSSSDKTFNSTFDGATISNPGLQIIGYVNTIVPYSPPVAVKTATP